MSSFIARLTFFLAAMNVATGVFIAEFLLLFDLQVANVSALRWTMMLGMPILLFVAFHRAASHHADSKTTLSLQAIGLLAVFIIPYGWMLRYAQTS